MSQRNNLRVIGVVVGLVLAVGCTLGPDPERPTTAADVSDNWVHAPEAETTPLPEVAPWWREFGDETTTELVELALENNPDLHAAAARVIEAEATLRRAGGARLPQVGYGASASTQLSEEAAREAVVHSVVAGVVRARVLVATAAWALDITRQITSSWESTTQTVERRYRAGIAGAVELHLARENLASARASEAVIEGQLEQARMALDVLVGRRPGSAEILPNTMPQLPPLEPVPLGLPAALLDRRPDLRQAELRLAAATYGVGAAVANLYPDLSLTGSVGASADRLNDLTISDGLVYNAIANLVGPLFTGGQRRADVDAAKARADQATAMYAGAVLNALREVEDALVLGDYTVESFNLTTDRVAEARAADRLAKQRYQRGVETLLTVLETERRLRLAEQAIITNTANVWNARIDLFLALGGDWGTDLPATETDPAEDNESLAKSEIPHSSFLIPNSKEVL
jgi:outer membrane protein TolC